jgi:hypothetical protein
VLSETLESEENSRFQNPEPIDNPFGPKLLPMSPEYSVTHVLGMRREILEAPPGLFRAETRERAQWRALRD